VSQNEHIAVRMSAFTHRSHRPFEWRPTPIQDRASYLGNSKKQEPSKSEYPEDGSDRTDGDFMDAADGDTKPSSDDKKSEATTTPGSQHILLVEDNKINQRLLSRKLEKKGFRVTAANNGQEAVQKIKELTGSDQRNAFSVILMDKEMPLLDGNDATKEIRSMEQRGEAQRTPIIGVTANVREEQQAEMLASGMDNVVTKPYQIDEMVATISKVTSAMKTAKLQKNLG
jgi:CheY-like chemotaxis protein